MSLAVWMGGFEVRWNKRKVLRDNTVVKYSLTIHNRRIFLLNRRVMFCI